MKLLIDVNMSFRWVSVLSQAGFQAAHWSALGSPHASDEEILAFALLHDFILVTHDLDCGTMLAGSGGLAPGLIQIRARDTSPELIEERMITALRHASAELERGALLTIDRDRIRLRRLPINGSPHKDPAAG